MTSDSKSFLLQFHTPSESLFDYGRCAELAVVLEAVHNSSGVDPKEITTWCHAFLSLFDVPGDLKGVLLAAPIIEHWVPQLLCEAEISAIDPIQILETFLDKLAGYPEPNIFRKKPRYAESQLFTYHLTAFGPSSTPCNLYEVWGRRIHEGLRKKQKTTDRTETVRWYATSARFFFKYFPHDQLTSNPAVINRDAFQQHVDLFKPAYMAYVTKTMNAFVNAEELAKDHECRLLSLYDIRKVNPNKHEAAWQGPEDPQPEHNWTRIQSESFDDRPSSGSIDHSLHRELGPIQAIVVEDFIQDDDETTANKDLVDPDPIIEDFIPPADEGPLLVKPPRLPWHHISRHILHLYPLWWDIAGLPVHVLMDLYQAAEVLLSDMPRTGAAGLFLITLPYCGRPPGELLGCEIGRASSELNLAERLIPKKLSVDPWSFMFFYLQDRRRSSFKPPVGTGWLSSTPAITFPIPHPLVSSYARYAEWIQSIKNQPEGQPFFQRLDAAGNLCPLTLQDIEGLVKSLLERFPHLPTPTALARGFSGLFIHGQNFDEVSARFIDGRFARSGPQPHYTHRRLLEFHDDFQRRAGNIHAAIVQALPLNGWWNEMPLIKARTSSIDSGVGSPLILGNRVFVRDVHRIGGTIKRTGSCHDGKALVHHHNAVVTYTSLVHGILGVRPRNEPNLPRALFVRPPDILPITDKLSSLYFENRLIGIPPIAVHLYAELARGREWLEQACRIYFDSTLAEQIPDDQLLFFLSDDGRVLQYTLSAYRDMLAKFGAEALAIAPLNVGRHRNRTEKVPAYADDVVNLHLGHNRAGREGLAQHASTFLGKAIGLLREHHEELLRKLGFEPLSYLPGVVRCTK